MEQAYAEEAYVVRPKKTKPAKKPNFISRWLWSGLKTASEAERAEKADIEAIQTKERVMLSKAAVMGGESLNVDPMHLKVWKANGGYIVETRTPTTDRQRGVISSGSDNSTKLHIITNDKDIGVEIGKIITLEGLRA